MPKIYTKRGDSGETGLLYGGRVPKTDPRCEAFGTTDEAVSALGLARALSDDTLLKEIVTQVLRELFTVGAGLASAPDQYATMQRHFSIISAPMVGHLEQIIDDLETQVRLPRSLKKERTETNKSNNKTSVDLAREPSKAPSPLKKRENRNHHKQQEKLR